LTFLLFFDKIIGEKKKGGLPLKILHMADCHLDAVMERNLPARIAKTRKRELLLTFAAAISAAKSEGATLALIAGDLFDTATPSQGAVRYVLDCIAAHADMTFLYIEGNHDVGALAGASLPDNLIRIPARTGKSVAIGDLTVHAAGFGADESVFSAFDMQAAGKHILLLHGILSTSRADTREEIIPRPYFDERRVDYIALGHLHTHSAMQTENGTLVCYSGTPEGRGFDETGRCGVVVYDTETRAADFLRTASRTLHDVTVDVTGAVTLPEIENRVSVAVGGIADTDMVRLTLTGEVEDHYLKQPEQIGSMLSGMFYFAKVKDAIRLLLRPERFRNDVSLRGGFVRRVLSDRDLSEEDKERVLTFGLRALEGELPEEAHT
jgi:DNA repair exonuclease SbcCD nuclease subunit